MTQLTAQRRDRARVLMVAYSCRPNEGSEPGMGWNRAVQAARQFDTWVLCEGTRCEPAIRSYLEAHGEIPGLHFVYVPRTRWEQWLAKVPALYYLAYNLWHRRAYAVAKRLHAEVQFDLVHQVTFCGYREPGYLWKLPVPFIWGPIGGTHNFPWRFLGQAGWDGAACELFRSLMNNLQFWLSPRVRHVARNAALALAGNSTTQRHFREAHGVDMPLMPASGIKEQIGEQRKFRDDDTLRLLWCGNLHPLKGLPILLQALARLPPNQRFVLRVVGAGPQRTRYERLSRRLGIAEHIEWTGWIPHQAALQQYQWADVFVFTSLRDTFPSVVLESLAAGLPVICLDHLGMGDIVDDTCGEKVPLTTPAEVIDGVCKAILSVTSNSQRWERLSQGAIERARRYTWSHQGRRLADYYRRVLGYGEANGTAEGDELEDGTLEERRSSSRIDGVARCAN